MSHASGNGRRLTVAFTVSTWLSIWPVWAGLLLVAGCDRSDEIRQYTVPKQAAIDALAGVDSTARRPNMAGVEDRTLGAIVAAGDQVWFFKLTGAAELVGQHGEAFRQLVASIKLPQGAPGVPSWTLPEGWRQLPASGIRYATIEIPSEADKALDLSVTMLPREEVDEAQYNLDNVNRWRGQLQLPPLALEELDEQSETIDLDGGRAVVVDLVGRQGGGMTAPFAGGGFGGESRPPLAAPPMAAPGDVPRSMPKLVYDVPEGWQEMPATGMRRAALRIGGASPAEVTVITASGSLADNINRWRGQVGLDALPGDEVQAAAEPIEVGSQRGWLVELLGPGSEPSRPAILGAIVEHRGQTWFVKLTASAELVQAERERFEAFVRSLQIPSEDPADGQ